MKGARRWAMQMRWQGGNGNGDIKCNASPRLPEGTMGSKAGAGGTEAPPNQLRHQGPELAAWTWAQRMEGVMANRSKGSSGLIFPVTRHLGSVTGAAFGFTFRQTRSQTPHPICSRRTKKGWSRNFVGHSRTAAIGCTQKSPSGCLKGQGRPEIRPNSRPSSGPGPHASQSA